MTKVYQTTFGKEGNCFSACLASIFEESIEKWEPTANHYPDWIEQTNRLLEEKGLEMNEVSCSLDEEIKEISINPMTVKNIGVKDGHLYLLGVRSTKLHLPHVIIGRFNKQLTDECGRLQFNIEHDPLGDSELHVTEVQAVLLLSRIFK